MITKNKWASTIDARKNPGEAKKRRESSWHRKNQEGKGTEGIKGQRNRKGAKNQVGRETKSKPIPCAESEDKQGMTKWNDEVGMKEQNYDAELLERKR